MIKDQYGAWLKSCNHVLLEDRIGGQTKSARLRTGHKAHLLFALSILGSSALVIALRSAHSHNIRLARLQNYQHFVKLRDCRNLQSLVFANRLSEELPARHHVTKEPANHRRAFSEIHQKTTASSANLQARDSLKQPSRKSVVSCQLERM